MYFGSEANIVFCFFGPSTKCQIAKCQKNDKKFNKAAAKLNNVNLRGVWGGDLYKFCNSFWLVGYNCFIY